MIPLALLTCLIAQKPEWIYLVPSDGDAMQHPSPMALPLLTEHTDDLLLAFQPDGFARYGELRYGDSDSRRVALLVLEPERGEAQLYLDLDRDRLLEEHERAPRQGDAWIVDLPVETRDEDGQLELVPRRVRFTLGERAGVFSACTMGYLEGAVQLGDVRVPVRRVDGDANGFFTDPRDQLWLDLDQDGSYSPLSELWLYTPLLELAGTRYALRSDRLGEDLEVSVVEGTGHLDLTLAVTGGAQSVRRLNALLVGRDGSAVGIRALGAPVEVPVGEYRLGMITLSLVDPDGGAEWSFVFSEPGGRRERTWYTLEKGGTLSIEALGELEFREGFASGPEALQPGDRLIGNPALYTQDGLLINTAYRGLSAPRGRYLSMNAQVRLEAPDGTVLATTSSGFA